MKENKKMVKAISRVMSEGKKDYALLKVKGKSIIKDMKKRWDASEPRRKMMEADAKKAVNKMIGAKGRKFVGKSVQFSKDIAKGVKKGLK
jgi:hypothetical protein